MKSSVTKAFRQKLDEYVIANGAKRNEAISSISIVLAIASLRRNDNC